MKNLYSLFVLFFISLPNFLFSQENSNFSTLQIQQDRWFSVFFDQALKYRLIGDYDKALEFYSKCIQLDEKSSSVLFEISRIFNFKKDYQNADKYMDLALKYDSTNNIHYIRYASDLKIGLGKFSEALSLYDEILKFDNEYYNYFISSRLCCQLNQFDKALSYLDKISTDDKLILDNILIERSDVYLKAGKFNKSLKILSNLYKNNPNNSKYSILMYKYYSSINDFDKSVEYCKISARLSEGEQMYFELADLYLSRSNFENFFIYSDSAFSNPYITPELKYSKLLSYLSNGSLNVVNNFDKFDNFLNICSNLHPDFEPFCLLASKFYISYKKFDKAIYVQKNFVSVNDVSCDFWHDFIVNLSSFSSRSDYEHYLQIAYNKYSSDAIIAFFYGEYLQSTENFKTSLDVLKSSLNSFNSNPNIYNEKLKVSILSSIASSYFYLDSLDACFSTFDEVLLLDNFNVLSLNNYSYFLSLTNRNLDKAESMIRKVIDIEPRNSIYLDTYAWVLYKKQRYSEALFIIERAIENAGSSWEIYDHYGDILFSNNEIEKAKNAWLKALELNKDNSNIINKIDSLNH